MTDDEQSVRERIGEAGESVRSAAGRAGRAAKTGAERTGRAAKEAATGEMAGKVKAGTKKAGMAAVEAGDKLREGAVDAAKEAVKPPDPNEMSLSELDSAVNRVTDRQKLLQMLEQEEEGRNRASARQIIQDRLDNVEAEDQQEQVERGIDFFGVEDDGLSETGFGFGTGGFADDQPDEAAEDAFFSETDDVDDVMFGVGEDDDEYDWLSF